MASRIPTPATQGAQRIGAVQLGEARNPFMNVTAPVEAFGGGDAATGLVSAGKAIMGGVDTLVDDELKDREDASRVRMMEAQNISGQAAVEISATMLSTQRGNSPGATDAALASFDERTANSRARLSDPDNHVSAAETAATNNALDAQRRAIERSGRDHERAQLALHETDLANTAVETAQQLAAINPDSPTAINIALSQSTSATERLADAEGVDAATKAQRVIAAKGSIYVAAIKGAINNNNTGRATELLEAARQGEFLTADQLISVEGQVNGKKDTEASEALFREHYRPGEPLPAQIDAIAASDAAQEVKDLAVGRLKQRHAVDIQAENELDAEAWDEAVKGVTKGGLHPSQLPQHVIDRLTADELSKLTGVAEDFGDRPADPLLAGRLYTAFENGQLAAYKSAEAAQIALGATGSDAQRDWLAGKWAEARALAERKAAAVGKAAAAADAWSSDIAANTAINDGLMKFGITSEDEKKYGAMRVRIGAEMDAAIAAGDPINTTTKLNHLIASLEINELYDMHVKGIPDMLLDDAVRALVAAGYELEEASDDDLLRETFGRYLSGVTDPAEIERILTDPTIVPRKGT